MLFFCFVLSQSFLNSLNKVVSDVGKELNKAAHDVSKEFNKAVDSTRSSPILVSQTVPPLGVAEILCEYEMAWYMACLQIVL